MLYRYASRVVRLRHPLFPGFGDSRFKIVSQISLRVKTWWRRSQESVRIVSLDWREIGELFGKSWWVYLSVCLFVCMSVCVIPSLLVCLCIWCSIYLSFVISCQSQLFHLIGIKLDNYLESNGEFFCLFFPSVCFSFYVYLSICTSVTVILNLIIVTYYLQKFLSLQSSLT